ncbi:Similar to Putative ankyrin repeat protein FPV162; acc. no. Q9J569 [Pyronema omphalodes CBS 100304]|uniref:Similar to Putative ankyrin repeat protein FPV162 acc. no. Q9J569 n=1 Tax=Pyronema omphalodes (strain CBS 100304) TaxID=1076935 RepID=U4LJC8_PYROM|nr:Similar to Putative ankyrin repeat protein FPV162; acc. no. Q9J569 [Pyronema omphalodes CBS 100304]
MGLATIPPELLIAVGEVCSLGTLSSLCRINWRFHHLLNPLLHKRGVQLANTSRSYTTNPAAYAIAHNRPSLVEKFLDFGMDPNTWWDIEDVTLYKMPLLCHSVISGKKDTVIARTLLERGADVNVEDGRGNTPLLLATRIFLRQVSEPSELSESYGSFGPSLNDWAILLLQYGAKVDHMDRHGHTALHMAASWGLTEVMPTLLNHGMDVNMLSHMGYTPLYHALVNHQGKAAIYLREMGGTEG